MNAPIFVVIGAKGGSGSTMIALELAQIGRRRPGVALVDADLSGRRSIAVLLDSIRTLDESRIDGMISSVRSSAGIDVIELTPNLHGGFTLRPTMVEEFVADKMDDASMVIVDAPQPFAAVVRPFITRAAKFLIIVEATVLGVTSARSMLVELVRFGIPVSRIAIVSNCRNGEREVSKTDIERSLGSPVAAEIPAKSDRKFVKAIDQLRDLLVATPALESLELLQPSARTPIGDRRDMHARKAGGGDFKPQAQPAVDAASSVSTGPDQAVEHSARTPQRSLDESPERVARQRLKTEVHAALQQRLENGAGSIMGTDAERMSELQSEVSSAIQTFLQGRSDLGGAEELAVLRREILDEALGYGPLEELMRDQAVSEIMVNGAKNIYVERSGKLTLSGQQFNDEAQLRLVIERMLAPIGRRIDESTPMVDGRLPDGSRINAVISPLALDGASLTIRRFGKRRLQVQDLIRLGAIAEPMVDFVRAAVQARLNIIISGGTGSGKTTFLNILSNFIPNDERIVTIEDAAELYLNQPHVVRLESRPANIEGKGKIEIRDLMRNSLRMRPDRIVVGECRGGEALDMLQAMNTGHDGSITTAHSNSPRDTISRIETMVLMAGFDLPIRAIREQIASAVDVIIHISRMRDGTRKVTSISEVVGMEGDVVTMQEIASFTPAGLDEHGKVIGTFAFSGVQPMCMKRFEESGIKFDIRELASMAPPVTTW